MTKGMDDECIWQQLELLNEEKFQSSLKTTSRFLAVNSDKFKLDLGDLESSDDEKSVNSDQEQSENEIESDQEELDDEEENEQEDDEEEDEENSENENELQANRFAKRKGRKSIVDDAFFKLSEMEEFLKDQDRKEMNKGNPTADDENIDYFADDNDEVNLAESLKYSDFFDPHEEDQENYDEEAEEEENYQEKEPKSTFEIKQERLKKKIMHMEEALLENKTWQMKGEIKADNRPQNSLLEEVLEFESTTRPAPIITEAVTFKLEDLIKQRIKDKAFDDVERKVKPSDIQIEYKKQIVLDQEKSKQSLAQVYEKEYIKELEKLNPNAGDEEEEEPKEHREIRAELKDLFEKLDLLSNFHYTPRPAQPELKIITNLPTIAMEEVAPIAVSNATMLAPEEIKSKTKGGNIIGAGERTQTDKNRERRHKKLFQKNKFSKETTSSKEKLLKKVTQSRNVEKVKKKFNFFQKYLINFLYFR
jgi:U3 small nucleolar RNA-associated protein MPP10